ncbi:hypothetical protein C2G38_2047510 [Gigaspora rosea]|uniref:Uncharacterized protein n=1 Tax=Gigaspora rosea TaxID=44941 RepID=A0A397U5R3_9GLOM|nr:hypothetical protein C2G38_2047510 [Gigaspora rosea]
MEVTFFVPVNKFERDPNVQAVFVKSEYYSVLEKLCPERIMMMVTSSTHLAIRRDIGSNRCLLKASLVGVAQDIPEEIDGESAMFKLSVNNYAGKNYSFVIHVVFPCNSSQFKYLMSSLCPNESILFIVGHIEVIQEDLYVYAAYVSFVEFNSAVKRKASNLSSSQTTSEVYRSVRSKLLTAHQNSNRKSSQPFLAEADKHLADPVIDSSCSRHTKVEDADDDDYIRKVDIGYSSCSQTVKDDKGYGDSNSESENSIIVENKEKGKERRYNL